MDGEKETVSVKWWNHRSALCRAIRDIYMKNLYADVKLVCEGQEHWVHKFVLSACSEYFEEILVDVPYRGSVTLSPLVQQKELLSLLDFMYLGIVDVLHEELPALVGAAEVLMIRGLAIPYEEEDSDQENPDKTKENAVFSKNLENLKKAETKTKITAEITAKRKRSEDTGSGELLEVTKEEECEYFPELDRVPKLEPSTSGEPLLERSPDQNCQVTSSNAEVNAMLKVLIGERPRRGRKKLANVINDVPEKAEVGRKEPEGLTCSQCNKTFQWRSNLTKHMRTHTGEKPYSCSICSYKTSYSEALKRHMRIHTGEKPYQCNYCDYKSRDHGSLKVHLKRHCSSESISASRYNPQDSDDSKLVINESNSISDFTTQNNQQKSDMIFENTNT